MDQRSRMSDMVVELRGETRQPWLTGKIDGTPVVAERLSSKEFSDYMAGKVAAEDLGLDHFKNYLDRSPEEKQAQGISR